ncbi:MAG: hypothetical protein AMXMBFR13_42740 [Phycisphaerae bacterium]
MIVNQRPERRARNVALAGLIFEVLLAGFFLILWVYSHSDPMRALALLTGVGSVIWLALVLVYHQRALVQDEAFEIEQLRRERDSGLTGGALFDTEGEQLLLARRRLTWMYRWMLPVFTAITVVALLSAALMGWGWSLWAPLNSDQWQPTKNLQSGLLIWFVGGAAFASFLFSRYAVGMARQAESQMLRAGASYLMGITLAAVATGATLAALHYAETAVPEHVLAKVLRGLMIVLAIEFTLNFVLDFYRPRSANEEPRPAFDSRLLGLFSEPGGIARSIADAINYQFGFDVSSTWFYKLLQRSVVPLAGFAVLTLFLASSTVLVDVDEEAVIEHFGERKTWTDSTGAAQSTLGPGLHFKWPWPIDITHKVATSQIHEMKIGLESAASHDAQDKKDELILWTNKHSQEPHLEVLVATPKLQEYLTSSSSATRPAAMTNELVPAVDQADDRPGLRREESRAVPVSLLRIAVTIQYRITDAWHWLKEYEAPQEMLAALANREIMRQCASADVMGIMGGQRGEIEANLRESIQAAANAAKLGVNIVFLGLQGVHPPEPTAEAFQEVVGAEQKRTASVNSAWADYNKKLSKAAGEVRRAEELAVAIERMNRLDADENANPEVRDQARRRVKELFFGAADRNLAPIGGEAAGKIAQAQAQRWKVANDAHAESLAFVQAMANMRAAPEVYQMRRYLDTLVEGMGNIRKFVLAASGNYEMPTFQLNLQEPMNASMDVAVDEANR